MKIIKKKEFFSIFFLPLPIGLLICDVGNCYFIVFLFCFETICFLLSWNSVKIVGLLKILILLIPVCDVKQNNLSHLTSSIRVLFPLFFCFYFSFYLFKRLFIFRTHLPQKSAIFESTRSPPKKNKSQIWSWNKHLERCFVFN